eukprot:EG_transcript_17457
MLLELLKDLHQHLTAKERHRQAGKGKAAPEAPPFTHCAPPQATPKAQNGEAPWPKLPRLAGKSPRQPVTDDAWSLPSSLPQDQKLPSELWATPRDVPSSPPDEAELRRHNTAQARHKMAGAGQPITDRTSMSAPLPEIKPRNARERKQRQIEHLARLKHQREQKAAMEATEALEAARRREEQAALLRRRYEKLPPKVVLPRDPVSQALVWDEATSSPPPAESNNPSAPPNEPVLRPKGVAVKADPAVAARAAFFVQFKDVTNKKVVLMSMEILDEIIDSVVSGEAKRRLQEREKQREQERRLVLRRKREVEERAKQQHRLLAQFDRRVDRRSVLFALDLVNEMVDAVASGEAQRRLQEKQRRQERERR